MKQKIKLGLFTILMLSILVLAGCTPSTQSGTVQTQQQTNSEASSGKLSGTLVEMNPNRMMAGAPCHVMGGQAAGDCQTREIQFEAYRYSWSEPTITVKTGELVRIRATSTDVDHGVAIPEIGFNIHIKPGEETVGEFIAPAPGEYAYGCSVMCGPGHHGHQGKLVVVE